MKIQISGAQAIILLLLCRMFYTVFFSPSYTQVTEVNAILIGDLIALVVSLILLLPLLFLFRKETQGNDLILECWGMSKWFGTAVILYYTALLLMVIIGTASRFQTFMANVVFPNAAALIILATFFIACIYAAVMGLEGIARVSSIIFVLFLISLAMILLFSGNKIQWVNLRPIHEKPVESLLETVVSNISKNMEFVVLILIYPKVKGKFWKISLSYLAISGLIIALVGGITILVLGEFTMKQLFPFYTVASIIENKIIQRMDALHMSLWVLISFVRVAVYLLLGSELIGRLLPEKKKGLSMPVISLLAFGGSYLLTVAGNNSETYYSILQNPIPIFLAVTVIPLIVLIGRRKSA